MNEREKILESIKKGILSPEEGLDLLESLGLKDTEIKAEETPEPQAENITEPETTSEPETTEAEAVGSEEEFEVEETPETEAASDFEDPAAFDEVPEQEYEEKIISEEVLEFNEEPAQEPESEAESTEINHEEKQPADSVASMIDEWENKAEPEPEETDPVRSKIDEFDLALQTKIETLRVKKEEFRELNLEAELGIISSENEALYNQMKIELKELEEEIELLKHERKAIDEDLFASPERPYVSDGFFEVPDDFEEQKYRPMDRPEVEPNDWASRIGRVVNRAAKTVTDTVNNSDFDLKKINQKFYGTAKTHFSHQFTFEDIDAQTIDIKLAKGKVILKTWEDETINDVKVEATVSLLGQMEEPDPIDAFLERSRIDVNNYQILFHVPNKRVDAKLTFYLPKRQYNNLALRLLNGDLMIEELSAKNSSIKTTNGTILIKELDASMLEFEGVNNEIEIREGQILDASIETVTGTIIARADIVRSEYSLINGDIKVTARNNNLKKLEAQSVNGDVKVSLPQTIGIEGSAKTGIGTINYRFANCETVQERSGNTQKVLHFQRAAENAAQIEVSSKAGSIYLKDFDK
ncbi:daptomycin-sensing surface protein LiaX [Enterococcus hulanensis]|uniref:daptomycin-sensing surface protein LiaX n=1 Tax=Enterococcus hulanensis TaxID=2559929 RepID=UPI0028909E16|nr:daptomycin-sensing surface protein LiaX [Enterococcus hulanensis]MDT2661309.1 daptomycin-sensing surface protein LiaX [Enterococcus hulanensis]